MTTLTNEEYELYLKFKNMLQQELASKGELYIVIKSSLNTKEGGITNG